MKIKKLILTENTKFRYDIEDITEETMFDGGEKVCAGCLMETMVETDKELEVLNEAEYQGRKVKLGKPMRGDNKKYKVFVKDPKSGNVKKVNFGDPNMKIKRDDPKRRKSFRARHKCQTAKDRTTPKYWSCKFWSKKPVSDLV
jgi:hypothetical protein